MPKGRHAQQKKIKAAREKDAQEKAVRKQVAYEEADSIKKVSTIEKEIVLKKYEEEQKKHELISTYFNNYLREKKLFLYQLNYETQKKLRHEISDHIDREEQLKKQEDVRVKYMLEKQAAIERHSLEKEADRVKVLLEKEAVRVKESLEKEAVRVKESLKENLKIKTHIKYFLEKNHISMENLDFNSIKKLVTRSCNKVKYDEETSDIEKYLENKKKINERFDHESTESCIYMTCNTCKMRSIAVHATCWYDEQMYFKIESRRNPSFLFHRICRENNQTFSVDSSEFQEEVKINNELRTIDGTIVYNFINSLYLEENKPNEF